MSDPVLFHSDDGLVFYYASPYIQQKDENGGLVCFTIDSVKGPLYLMHPDNVQVFLKAADEAGRTALPVYSEGQREP